MTICKYCGEEFEFRYIDGVCTPIHINGGYCSEYGNRESSRTDRNRETSFAYHSSMRELAQELSHSLIFPVLCRHCERLIYLFANPDGGFAIFDRLGKPWPKHQCGLVRPTTREYSSQGTVFSSRHRLPVPDRIVEGALEVGQSLRGSVVAVEDGRIEVFDGIHRYWVAPSNSVQVGQVIEGVVRSVQANLELLVTVVPPPTRDELAASETTAMAAEGEVIDIDKHNQTINLLGQLFEKRVKVVWGVFSNTNQRVATFEYKNRAEADAYAAQLREKRRATFYVSPVREFME